MNTKIYIAHIRNGKEYQLLEEHLSGTSKLASQFASKFHYGDWGRLLGLWHDIGKYSESFQQYSRQKSGLIEEEEIFGKVDHSSAGAIYAKEVLGKFGIPLAYCIAGHHTGLLNWNNEIGLSGNMIDRLQKESLNNIRTNIKEKVASIESQLTIHKPFKEEEIHVWIRMLYSCLVDADYLDTERFMSPETFEKRGHFTSIKLLKEQFDTYMSSLKISATPSFINKQREEILIAC
ncbi:MAG: CRISPR-associated endonuclease Cas3'', partial [Bacteroides sp.]